jgi:aspartate 1-decarboxylase
MTDEEARRHSPRLVYVNSDNVMVEKKKASGMMTFLEA